MTPREMLDKARAFLRGRQHDYQITFSGVQAQRVLADLARFCRAHRSTFHPEHAASDRLDGRREVWLRIQQHLKLDDEQLWKLYGKGSE